MRKPLLACVFLLMIVAALALAKNITTHAAVEPIKSEPEFAHCSCKVRANGLDVDTLTYPGYNEINDKKLCEAKCQLAWDVTGPGNTQILAWAKKLPGACGLVKVTMEAFIGARPASIVRSHSIDVGVACPPNGGPGDPAGKFVSVKEVGTNFIKIKFGDDIPPLQWKILWATFAHPPTCESAGNHFIIDNTSIGSRTGEHTIAGLSNNKTYYFQVCSKSSSPIRKLIGKSSAKTLR